MIVGYSKMSLFFPNGASLKSKRQLLRSIVDKTKNRFNISVAEVEDHNLWQKATLGIAYVSLTDFQAKKTLRSIGDYIDSLGKGRISDYRIETVKIER